MHRICNLQNAQNLQLREYTEFAVSRLYRFRITRICSVCNLQNLQSPEFTELGHAQQQTYDMTMNMELKREVNEKDDSPTEDE